VSNLIGWGVVYCSTWFGQVDETTLSIQNESAPPCFAPANDIAIYFEERVLADGGTFEGYDCLVAAIQDLGEDTYYDLFDTYIQRMTDDGATLEGEECLIDQLFILN
jgi:hypothetical protein